MPARADLVTSAVAVPKSFLYLAKGSGGGRMQVEFRTGTLCTITTVTCQYPGVKEQTPNAAATARRAFKGKNERENVRELHD